MRFHNIGQYVILLVPHLNMTVRYFESTNYSFLDENVRQPRMSAPCDVASTFK